MAAATHAASGMVIGKTDEEEEAEVAESWRRATTRRMLMDDGPRGPEPEVIHLKNREESDSDDDEEVYTKSGTPIGMAESRHRASLVKAAVAATACCFFLLIYLTSYFAMDPGGLGSINGNPKTAIKVGRILGMQDARYPPPASKATDSAHV